MYLDGRKQKISFVFVFFQKGEKKKPQKSEENLGKQLGGVILYSKKIKKKNQKKQKTEIVQFDLVMSY